MTNLPIKNVEDLNDSISAGMRVEYIFFWGHTQSHGVVSKTCLSQWYDAAFTSQEDVYQTVEHFMMAEKARLFGDIEKVGRILAAETPRKAKAIGREIQNFDEVVWDQHKFEIVVRGNLEKFSQHHELKEYLLNTDHHILVEASPVDKVWGVGLAADNPLIQNPRTWKGQNLLGFALMEVRRNLKKTC
ncbi:MAG: NADAR family protein [Geminicoccales bacterium]